MSTWLRVRLLVDRAVAAILGVLFAPIIGVLALLIKRHDGGPGFVRVERVGRNGSHFRMWKLRSMQADSRDGRAAGPTLTGGAGDERITPMGRRLRSYHLDELPQLWNVAAGEMGLLGPRPESPEYVDPLDQRWAEILQVPPGIAGPTQLIVGDWERGVIAAAPDGSSYRASVLPVKLAIDQWYVRSASPATDFLVAASLLRRFLPGGESWTLKHRVMVDVPEAAPAYAYLRAQESARVHSGAERRAAMANAPMRTAMNIVAHALDSRVARRARTDETLRFVPRKVHNVFEAEFDEGVILFDGAKSSFHQLSPEAAMVWRRCDGCASVVDIALELTDEHNAHFDVILRDVATVVLQLSDRGALVDARTNPRSDERSASAVSKPLSGRRQGQPSVLPEGRGLGLNHSYRTLGQTFAVQVEDPTLDRALAWALQPLLSESAADHVFLIEPGRDGEVTVYCDGRSIAQVRDRGDSLVEALLKVVRQELIAASPYPLVKGALIESVGSAAGLIGSSVLWDVFADSVLAAGYRRVPGRYLAFDLANQRVIAFPGCFEPGSELVVRLAVPSEDEFRSTRMSGEVDSIGPAASTSYPGSGPCELTVLLAPRDDGPVRRLSQTEFFIELLEHVPDSNRITEARFSGLSDVARRLTGWRIVDDASDKRLAGAVEILADLQRLGRCEFSQ